MEIHYPHLQDRNAGSQTYYALQWKAPEMYEWNTYIHATADSSIDSCVEYINGAFRRGVETRILKVEEKREVAWESGN